MLRVCMYGVHDQPEGEDELENGVHHEGIHLEDLDQPDNRPKPTQTHQPMKVITFTNSLSPPPPFMRFDPSLSNAL